LSHVLILYRKPSNVTIFRCLTVDNLCPSVMVVRVRDVSLVGEFMVSSTFNWC